MKREKRRAESGVAPRRGADDRRGACVVLYEVVNTKDLREYRIFGYKVLNT